MLRREIDSYSCCATGTGTLRTMRDTKPVGIAVSAKTLAISIRVVCECMRTRTLRVVVFSSGSTVRLVNLIVHAVTASIRRNINRAIRAGTIGLGFDRRGILAGFRSERESIRSHGSSRYEDSQNQQYRNQLFHDVPPVT